MLWSLEKLVKGTSSAMPKPMKVKIFMKAKASVVEEQINAWLDYAGAATIIKTETVVTANAIENAPIVDTRHAARLVGEHCVNDSPLAIGKLVAHIGRLRPSVTRRPRRPISAVFCP